MPAWALYASFLCGRAMHQTPGNRHPTPRRCLSPLCLYSTNTTRNTTFSFFFLLSLLFRVQILPDLVLDTPAAPSLLDKFTEQAKLDGCLPEDYKAPTPPAPDANGNGVAPAENGIQGA